jgi:predicted nucleic acid-binding protein
VIFVDANVFLRHLLQPGTPHDQINAQRAAELFRQAEAGTREITTSDAILAEVVFILSDARHYNFPRSDVQIGVASLLRSRGLKLNAKGACLRALELWVAYPKLSFPDALGAAYTELGGFELATFDAALSRIPELTPYRFVPISEHP